MRLPPLHVVVPSAAVVREISEYPEKRLYQNPASITALTMMARNLQIMNLRKNASNRPGSFSAARTGSLPMSGEWYCPRAMACERLYRRMNSEFTPAPKNRSKNVTIWNTGQSWLAWSLICVSHTRLMKSMPYSKCPPAPRPSRPLAKSPSATDVGRHKMPPPIIVSASVRTLIAYSATTMNSNVSSCPTTSLSPASDFDLRLRALWRW